ncbi:MAG: hypothetical protein GX592_00320, partial [Clostridiales bacterium]|nr:hypothetical protein [Clostridiales bacterium]
MNYSEQEKAALAQMLAESEYARSLAEQDMLAWKRDNGIHDKQNAPLIVCEDGYFKPLE